MFYGKLEEKSSDFAETQKYYAQRAEKERTLLATVACVGVMVSVIAALYTAGGHPAEIITVFALSTAAVGCIHDALSEGTNFGFVFGAAYRIVDVLDIPTPVRDSGRKTVEQMSYESDVYKLSFKNVMFAYEGKRDQTILRDVSFDALPGEITAIVSASGGGKSTMVKLMQRFWDVNAGAILINGTDIRSLRLKDLRDLITVVSQEVYLFNGTIESNLRMICPSASEEDILKASNQAQAHSFIQKMEAGYATRIGENGMMLSGGEKQRLALAQAFLKNSPILILDEATSALDTENEQRINRVIRESGRKRTTIVVAHRLSSMMNADKIVFLKDGCVNQIGHYDDLIRTNAAFRELVRGEYHGKQ